ncbi:DsbA family protein [Streptomyces millisiae]|uniref:Thioredoxin domain-containing protein n=1 Tax=Streptomyces millisiae TaxID=3075542 RepID=A0ABU2LYX3_9ACTN|nr:thioredoxin domain-containing protein [Streptomyces sp. DSM 44918]MDT0322796.1 thioredoxin domain-containing protein [Streptomyces sp. DSM 44918]
MPVSRSRKPKNSKAKAVARPTPARRSRPAPVRFGVVALAALLVCALVVGAVSALGGGGGGGGSPTQGESPTAPQGDQGNPAESLERRDADDPYALGDVDAPVVMLQYTDFQSAFDGVHARDAHDDLVREFVDSGVLRIEFRQFPINGPESDAAARASWAAGQQGRFWEFYEVALDEEFHQNDGRFSEERLPELAERAGVADVDRFLADMESEAATETMTRDTNEALSLGVSATPSFLVNGQPLQGAQPLDAFRTAIEAAADAAQG